MTILSEIKNTCDAKTFYGQLFYQVQLGVSAASILHEYFAYFFGLEVILVCFDAVYHEGYLSESTEKSFPQSDKYLFYDILFDDSLVVRHEVFDEVHERA